MQTINWHYKTFEELSKKELYDIFAFRQEVFIVEQACFYQDADYYDQSSKHLFCYNEKNEIIAYARIMPPGVYFKELCIGRVVSRKSLRGSGLGMQLMSKAIEYAAQEYGKVPIKIVAQSYLEAFYEKFGFKAITEEFLFDNLPHKEMLRA